MHAFGMTLSSLLAAESEVGSRLNRLAGQPVWRDPGCDSAALTEAADELFYRQGYEHTSFSNIAGAVQISRGNFYHHFKTKDEILDTYPLTPRRHHHMFIVLLRFSEGVVSAEIVEIAPSRTDERLRFLLG